jgi:pantoate--beta-alanine ligase
VKLVRTIEEMRALLVSKRTAGLVPTMGSYHAGHEALFTRARAENEVVVASLFVNPAQFGDDADLSAYPRDEQRDAEIAERHAVDVLFAPSVGEIYPDGFQTWVEVEEVARRLEGDARPGHFRGVATVCLKLFNIVQPTRAYFGQKDAQQVKVVRRLVRDLNVPVEIRVVPTVRDDDGLALSSRNVRLSPEERVRARALPRALQAAIGADDPVAAARAELNGLRPDYVELLELDDATLLVAAARVGSIRLIDNVVVKGTLK